MSWLLGITFTLLFLFFGLLIVKKSAEWLGASEATWLRVFVAVVAAAVLGGIASLLLVEYFLLGMVASFVITGCVYALCLQASVPRGIGIALLSTILWVPVVVLLVGIYGAIYGFDMVRTLASSKMLSEEINVQTVAARSEDVCRCGADTACLEKKMFILGLVLAQAENTQLSNDERELIQQRSQDALDCAATPREYVVREQDSAPEESDIVAAPEVLPRIAAPAVGTKSPTIVTAPIATGVQREVVAEGPAKYSYRATSKGKLNQHIDARVRVRTVQGSIREGILVSVFPRRITVQKSKNLSGFAYEIPNSDIASVEVYAEVSQ